MEDNAIVHYTFSGVAGSSVTVTISGKECKLLKDRENQNFSKKDTLKNITSKIENAKNIAELEKIACKTDICDVCRLKKLNLKLVVHICLLPNVHLDATYPQNAINRLLISLVL